MERWAGKVALVSGASSGIGAEIVKQFLKYGLKVVGCARNVKAIEEIAASSGALPGKLTAIKCDLAKEDEIKAMFERIRKEFGTIHICVNNAGMSVSDKLLEMTADKMRAMLDVNVVGLVLCTNEAVKLMKETGVNDGHIVHISSIMGHRVTDNWHFYSATKYAVRALTEGYRKDLAVDTRIRVTAISPGLTETGFATNMLGKEEGEARYKAAHSRGTIMSSGDVAGAVIYAISAPENVQIHDILMMPTGNR